MAWAPWHTLLVGGDVVAAPAPGAAAGVVAAAKRPTLQCRDSSHRCSEGFSKGCCLDLEGLHRSEEAALAVPSQRHHQRGTRCLPALAPGLRLPLQLLLLLPPPLRAAVARPHLHPAWAVRPYDWALLLALLIQQLRLGLLLLLLPTARPQALQLLARQRRLHIRAVMPRFRVPVKITARSACRQPVFLNAARHAFRPRRQFRSDSSWTALLRRLLLRHHCRGLPLLVRTATSRYQAQRRR